MTFFEQTLRQILQNIDATYIGKTAYVKNGNNRIKISIYNTFSVDQYDAIALAVLNKEDGQLDGITLKFSDLIGIKPTNNPNFRNGISPHIWKDGREIDWYVYCPTIEDFNTMHETVKAYIDLWNQKGERK